MWTCCCILDMPRRSSLHTEAAMADMQSAAASDTRNNLLDRDLCMAAVQQRSPLEKHKQQRLIQTCSARWSRRRRPSRKAAHCARACTTALRQRSESAAELCVLGRASCMPDCLPFACGQYRPPASQGTHELPKFCPTVHDDHDKPQRQAGFLPIKE